MTRPFWITELLVELVELVAVYRNVFSLLEPVSRIFGHSLVGRRSPPPMSCGIRFGCGTRHAARRVIIPTRQDRSLAKLSACTHSSAIVQKGDDKSGSWV